MGEHTKVRFEEKDRLKILKFIIKLYNNFEVSTFDDMTISVNQSLTSNEISDVAKFISRNKAFIAEYGDKTITFKYNEV